MSVPPVQHYDSQFPLYGVAFSHSPFHPNRVALTTYSTAPTNKLLIVDEISSSSPTYQSSSNYQQLASASIQVPATKVAWEPRQSIPRDGSGGRGELLATSGDVLRLWEMGEGGSSQGGYGDGYVGRGWSNGQGGGGGGYSLNPRAVLTNSKLPATSLPPITSLSWNAVSPNSVVTCSIDTTATLWDISHQTAVTQLIAHDKAVYDLSWLPDSSDIFVSVGADGSLRAFDLRTLEHSTILYESAADTPLARIAFSNREQHMLACFGMDESKVLILDMRSPGQPVAELVGHQAPVSGIAWGSGGNGSSISGGGWIASCGDDSQLLMYDLTDPLPTPDEEPTPNLKSSRSKSHPNALSPPVTPARRTPSPALGTTNEILPTKAWTGSGEINNLAFTDVGDRIGCVSGSRLSVLAV